MQLPEQAIIVWTENGPAQLQLKVQVESMTGDPTQSMAQEHPLQRCEATSFALCLTALQLSSKSLSLSNIQAFSKGNGVSASSPWEGASG